MNARKKNKLYRQVNPLVGMSALLTTVTAAAFAVAYFLIVVPGSMPEVTPMQNQEVLAQTTSFGNALLLNGAGVQDGDRVKIPVRNTAANIGATDFTIEFWLNATLTANRSSTCTEGNDTWITGNIILDRDIFNTPSYGDFGVSLAGGRIAFGLHNGSQGMTICSPANIADGQWHHVAVSRRASDGMMYIHIDGVLSRSYDGPNGNISYNNTRTTTWPNDPFLVIGAEKHDYDPSTYPSYAGLFDELRVSSSLRYSGNFSRPGTPFSYDASTILLYHFDETGTPATTVDVASGVNGQVRYYNTYPRFVTSTVPASDSSPTPTPSINPSPSIVPTPTPTPSPVVSPSPIPSPSLSPSPLPSSSGPTSGNFFLRFDGTNDVMTGRDIPLLSTYTIEAWVRRNVDKNNYETILADANSSYSRSTITLFVDGAGGECGQSDQFAFYQRSPDQVQCSGVVAQLNQWYHLAVVRDAGGTRRFFVNGQLTNTQSNTTAAANSTGLFSLGRAGSYNGEYFGGDIDEVHLSSRARYAAAFTPPTSVTSETESIFLYRMSEGTGQAVNDSSGRGRHGVLGTSTSAQSSDPSWSAN